MIQENWKPIFGTENCFVSDNGRIMKNNLIVEPKIDSEGYKRVSLGKNRGRVRIHVLVAEAFCKKTKGRIFVNHIKGKQISVCEDESEAYEYWKEHFNPNKEDCCNLRMKSV